jgi:hypothetical protein
MLDDITADSNIFECKTEQAVTIICSANAPPLT